MTTEELITLSILLKKMDKDLSENETSHTFDAEHKAIATILNIIE